MNNPLNFALWQILPGDKPLLFLACPYSHPDSSIRALRATEASAMAARLMARGYAVFSPISHGHAICDLDCSGSVGTCAPSWAVVNDATMTVCDALAVLDIAGLWESAGVRREVALAKDLGLPVNLLRIGENGLEVEPDISPMLWSDNEGTL